jgi:hypothetical protein
MSKFKDLSGIRFGRLIVIERTNKPDYVKGYKIYYLCKCDCGKEKTIRREHLLSGKTKSCGCYQHEIEHNRIGKTAKNELFWRYTSSAKRKNIVFSLTKEEFLEITSKNCFYCGLEPFKVKNSKWDNGNYIFNGIDRLDNTKGYIESNVVPCCWTCNQAKHEMMVTDFYEWSDRLYEYRHKIA